MSTQLFVTFWWLSLPDLMVPDKTYQETIQTFTKQLVCRDPLLNVVGGGVVVVGGGVGVVVGDT